MLPVSAQPFPIHRDDRLKALRLLPSQFRSDRALWRRRILAVDGDFDHFKKSIVGKCADVGLFEAFPAGDVINESASDIVGIRWPGAADRGSCSDLPLLWDRVINAKPLPKLQKWHVEAAFLDVFGYSISVDPRSHVGDIVAKSVYNAMHDGRIIRGPVEADADAGVTYQRLVRNEVGSIGGFEYVADLRVVCMRGVFPFCYLKFRKERNRFQNSNEYSSIEYTSDLMTPTEIASLERFVDRINLDYAELDVLLDRFDKRLYVVDANDTPYGPPTGLESGCSEMAVNMYAHELTQRLWPHRK